MSIPTTRKLNRLAWCAGAAEKSQRAVPEETPIAIAVSAPKALAIRTAEAATITLIGMGRGDEFEIFTHPERIATGGIAHVA